LKLNHRLEKQGHFLTIARNGHQAVQAFQQGGIDIILMDIIMPEMDGLEATRMIRNIEDSNSGKVPIIALTASVMKEERNKCTKAGINQVISKPIDFMHLFAIMENLVPKGVGIVRIENVPQKKNDTSPTIDGVNVEKGLKIWDDKKAFLNALSDFSRKYGNIGEKIEELMESDMESAQILTHTLKGLSGNLSITKVYSITEELYILLNKKQIEKAKQLITPLKEALIQVTSAIDKLGIGGKNEKKTKKEMDINHVSKLFKDMLNKFEEYNPSVVEPIISELDEYLPDEQLEAIKTEISRFDISAAKDEALKLAEQLKINL